jgi:hypothetical protein
MYKGGIESLTCGNATIFFKKEVARGGEQTQVLLISFTFSFFTTLPLSQSGSPKMQRSLKCSFFSQKL